MAKAQDRNLVVTASGLKALLQHPLSKIEHSVLWYLAAKLPPAGDVVSQIQMASDLATNPAYMGRAVRKLCSSGLLVRGVRSGLSYHYKLNPLFFRLFI